MLLLLIKLESSFHSYSGYCIVHHFSHLGKLPVATEGKQKHYLLPDIETLFFWDILYPVTELHNESEAYREHILMPMGSVSYGYYTAQTTFGS